MSPQPDLLASGPDRTRRRWPALLLTLLLLVGAAGHAGDAALRTREVSGLLAAAEAAQEQLAYAERRVQATVQYASPQLYAADVPAQVRRSLQQLVEGTAHSQLAATDRARARVAGISTAPWHPAQRSARRALLRYLDARAAGLRAVAADSGALSAPRPEVDRLLAAAREAALAAAGPGARARVDGAFPPG